MITQNEDYRAEIFYKHKFRASQRTGSIIDTASIDTYIKYLYETGPRDKNGDIIDVTERVTTTTLCTQCVDYAVKESSKFYKFFEYIEFLGAKRMTIVDTTGDYEHYVYNGKEYYEYNNCVFVKVGFDRRTQEFIISMLGSKIFNYKYTLAK